MAVAIHPIFKICPSVIEVEEPGPESFTRRV
jgi:hypothetical protein